MSSSRQRRQIPHCCLVGTYPSRASAILLAGAIANITSAQPPAAGLGSLVDKFTGDFNYSVPLFNIPGPNGESFPLVLEYNSGGIGVDQAASEIGLGWSLPIGEIVRNVNGRPDDAKAYRYRHSKVPAIEGSVNCMNSLEEEMDEDLRGYGPVHFKEITSDNPGCVDCKHMDLYSTRSGITDGKLSFEFPDYDDYAIAGPALSGKLKMHLFDHSWMYYERQVGDEVVFTNHVDTDHPVTTKRPVLVSVDAAELNITAPVGSGVANGWTSWNDGSDSDDPPTEGHPADFPSPPGNSFYGDDLVLGTHAHTVKSGRQVRYFTNAEIIAHQNGQTPIPGFVDWKAASDYPFRTDAGGFPSNAIGAIQVIAEDGTWYHYSLPVHQRDEVRFSFELHHDGTSFAPFRTSSGPKEFDKHEAPDDFATSWKLTAITGHDYVDDGDGIPDDGDSGYWIRFDYEKWADDFSTRYPAFGYQVDLGGAGLFTPYNGITSFTRPGYNRTGSVVNRKHEVYYLNRISTATHSALFIREVRYDEHSVDPTPKPLLRLSKVLLVRNAELSSTTFPPTLPPSIAPFNNADMGCTPGNIYNSDQLEASDLLSRTLAGVELLQDYSLAKGYYTNINSGYTSAICTAPPSACEQVYLLEPTGITPVDHAASGKLTLMKLRVSGLGGLVTTPMYEFGYYDQIDGDPLDHDYRKKDHFGHYKFNHDPYSWGGYTTATSAERLHAWSLRSITDPLGAKVDVLYEPDRYELTGYPSQRGTPPTRYYHLKYVWTGCSYSSCAALSLGDRDALEELLPGSAGGRYEKYELYHELTCDGSLTHDLKLVRFQNNPSTTIPNPIYALNIAGGSLWGNNCIDFSSPDWSGEFVKITYKQQIGGGVRVKQLNLSANGQPTYRLDLTYEGGVCVAEPDMIEEDLPYLGPMGWDRRRYLTMDRASGDRHAPYGGVGYTVVNERILEPDGSIAGSVEHEFKNYTDQGSYVNRTYVHQGTIWYNVPHFTKHADDRGKTLRVSQKDKNGTLLSLTINHFDQVTSRISEAFSTDGSFDQDGYGVISQYGTTVAPNIRSTFIKTEEYSKLTKVEQWENGNLTLIEYSDFDHNTGAPRTTTVRRNGMAQEKVTTEPAYLTHQELGPIWGSPTNKNRLTGSRGSLHNNGTGQRMDWGEEHAIRDYSPLSGSFLTNVEQTQWTPTRSYTRTKAIPEEWTYLGRPTLFDRTMRPLEQRDRAGNMAATKRTLSGEYILSEASNCNYASFTYSSFEGAEDRTGPQGDIRWFDGEVRATTTEAAMRVTGTPTLAPHSGKHALRVSADAEGASYVINTEDMSLDGETFNIGLLPGRTYRALVWVHNSSPGTAGMELQLDGSPQSTVSVERASDQALVVGDWTRIEGRIHVPPDYISSGTGNGLTVVLTNRDGNAPAFFDDLLVQPIDAQVATAVWDETTGLQKASMGPTGFVTSYVHDPSGQVVEVHQEFETGVRLMQKNELHFKPTIE